MIEVELKARVADRRAVEARLREFATEVGTFDKRDAYWHGPEWRINRGTRGFRVRSENDSFTVTFKNKRSEGGIEINREREFAIADLAVFTEFIERLGCEPFFEKRKIGSRWEWRSEDSSRPIVLELLEVPGLGLFLEIEALVADEDPSAIALARGEISLLLEKSGLDESAIEPRYYSELLMEAGLGPRW
ncbi:MAG TPA: class IV adenylate cyclase [Rectinemataceae bacterium]|nr:class IV adenylate cyclase [Rectinemataceae bacterium]